MRSYNRSRRRIGSQINENLTSLPNQTTDRIKEAIKMLRKAFQAMLILFTLLIVTSAFSETEAVLYSFQGGAGGADPYQSGVVMDKSGNLYGVLSSGGQGGTNCFGEGCGLIYELSPNPGGGWEETSLYVFKGRDDGGSPVGNLTIDAKGNLYGVTEQGGTGGCNSVLGAGCGVVFRLSPSKKGWKYSVIHSFESDGSYPNAGVVFDEAGNLYGTTQFGGDFFCGCGIVYQLKPVGKGKWTENTLYDFLGISRGGTDVSFPGSDVFIDANGNIFGTGTGGGDVNCNDGCGGVYELVAQGNGTYQEEVLHVFTGGRDGIQPYGGVLLDSEGNIFGTTALGGGRGCNNGKFGCGTVFELKKSGDSYEEKIIFRFTGDNGYNPVADLYLDSANNLYSTTAAGGAFNNGVAFSLGISSGKWTETVLYSFGSGTDGASSWASLTPDGSGGFFGTTRVGGANGAGTVFHLQP
jgi:hypothetical protein